MTAHAQQNGAGLAGTLNQLQQSLGNGTSGIGSGGLGNFGQSTTSPQDLQDVTQRPVSPLAQVTLPTSRLEQIMSVRAGAKLKQFGYDQLGVGQSVTTPQAGAVQDDYILGPGDEIIVSLRGQENGDLRVAVNRNGQVLLPRLNPIAASGRTFGAFREDIEAAVHRAYIATSAFPTIARVRQINVLVSGEVNVPGTRILTGLSSVVDALLLSGGVKKTGSLRNIRIQRGSSNIVVDLYSVLTDTGRTNQMRLMDGDRILVAPLGKTVAVSGLVRQPGIFELPIGISSIPERSLLSLAGGLEVRGHYRLSVLRVSVDGSSQMVRLAGETGSIGDSEILFVDLGADQTTGQAILSGSTGLAGQYPIATGTRLSEVIKAPGALGPAPYTLFGIIARKDSRTLLRRLVAFSPVAVLNGNEDIALQSDDIIRILSVNEVRLLTNTVRLYNQRQMAEQDAIRNPLAAPDVTAAITAASPATAAQASQIQSQVQNSDGQNAEAAASGANLTDLQRRDIATIAEQVDPVTQQTSHAQARAQQQQVAEQQQALLQQNPQFQTAQNYAFQGPLTQNGLPGQMQNNQPAPVIGQLDAYGLPLANSAPPTRPYGTLGQPIIVTQPPALNFQTVDAASGQIASNREVGNFGDLARQLAVDQLVLVNFLIDHQVVLNGAVSGPGSYFVGPNIALQDLVQAAGGTSNWADESGVELISTAVDTQSGRSRTQRLQLPLRQGMLASYIVHPRDQFRFNQIFTDSGLGTATVQGEIRFSGTYQITRGEHLSDLMSRSGGLTNTAYPYGTVFLRKSAAAAEHDGYVRAAKEIEEQLVVAMTRIGNDKIDPSTFASLQTFVTELRNQKAVGRISIAADPSILASKPELDPLLEPGDVIYIPQRPSTVSVLGQVAQAGSYPYRSGLTVGDYIGMAGGYGANSDKSQTFIVLPDGSARKVEQSWLNFSSNSLPPGSAIVIPRDVTPLDTRQLILDVSQIFSQLAVSIASVAVISR